MATQAKTYCIIHPGSELDGGAAGLKYSTEVVEVHGSAGADTYEFDRVFGPGSSQEAIFEEVARGAVLSAVRRLESAAFLAFGATAGGKTFVVTGGVQRFADRGLIPRSISALFEELSARPDREDFEVSVSFYEIYKDSVVDLLSGQGQRVPAQEADREGMRRLRRKAATESDAYHLLFQGDANRHFEKLPLNVETSRGHVFYTVHLVHALSGSEAELAFIDLAADAGTTDLANSSIVRTIGTVRNVLQALHERREPLYEASMMGHLLKPWLDPTRGGSGQPPVHIALLNPLRYSPQQCGEIRSWLDFTRLALAALAGNGSEDAMHTAATEAADAFWAKLSYGHNSAESRGSSRAGGFSAFQRVAEQLASGSASAVGSSSQLLQQQQQQQPQQEQQPSSAVPSGSGSGSGISSYSAFNRASEHLSSGSAALSSAHLKQQSGDTAVPSSSGFGSAVASGSNGLCAGSGSSLDSGSRQLTPAGSRINGGASSGPFAFFVQALRDSAADLAQPADAGGGGGGGSGHAAGSAALAAVAALAAAGAEQRRPSGAALDGSAGAMPREPVTGDLAAEAALQPPPYNGCGEPAADGSMPCWSPSFGLKGESLDDPTLAALAKMFANAPGLVEAMGAAPFGSAPRPSTVPALQLGRLSGSSVDRASVGAAAAAAAAMASEPKVPAAPPPVASDGRWGHAAPAAPPAAALARYQSSPALALLQQVGLAARAASPPRPAVHAGALHRSPTPPPGDATRPPRSVSPNSRRPPALAFEYCSAAPLPSRGALPVSPCAAAAAAQRHSAVAQPAVAQWSVAAAPPASPLLLPGRAGSSGAATPTVAWRATAAGPPRSVSPPQRPRHVPASPQPMGTSVSAAAQRAWSPQPAAHQSAAFLPPRSVAVLPLPLAGPSVAVLGQAAGPLTAAPPGSMPAMAARVQSVAVLPGVQHRSVTPTRASSPMGSWQAPGLQGLVPSQAHLRPQVATCLVSHGSPHRSSTPLPSSGRSLDAASVGARSPMGTMGPPPPLFVTGGNGAFLSGGSISGAASTAGGLSPQNQRLVQCQFNLLSPQRQRPVNTLSGVVGANGVAFARPGTMVSSV